jgi:SAM-dependent methyltransferase
MSEDARPHSERYFTDSRDHWWHADYVALIGQRAGLGACEAVLEVGAGQGHFARALAPALAPGFTFTLVDREARSLALALPRCEAWAAERGVVGRFRAAVASAEALPFADDSFDLVCCQTLLIHVADRERVFAEMLRVCKPGGLLLAVEPNNRAGLQYNAAEGPAADLGRHLQVARLQLRCVAGKAALGEGWNDAGVHLPRLFAGLEGVAYANNDRAWVMAPPYDSPQQAAALQDLRRDVAEGVYGWPRAEARRFYLAGGGSLAELEADYAAALALQADQLASAEAGRWTALIAFAGLIATGRKPGQAR